MAILSVIAPQAQSSRVVRQLCGCRLTQPSIPKCHEVSKGQIFTFKHSTSRDDVVRRSFHLCFCKGAKISSVSCVSLMALADPIFVAKQCICEVF